MDAIRIRRTYRWMAPFYDPLFRRLYRGIRRESIRGLGLGPADVVVLVGVGTGLDIPVLPPVARVIAVDLTPAMLHRAKRAHGASRVDYAIADGARLPLRDDSVTGVIFHLVLCVAPNPQQLLREAARVLRPGGRVLILDHFARPGPPGAFTRLLGKFPGLIGTHVDRSFESMAAGLPFKTVSDRYLARGHYRTVVLRLEADRHGRGVTGITTSPCSDQTTT